MTTSNSPLERLTIQANNIARVMKTARPNGKGCFKTGIVMDDKVIIIEMTWEAIKETSEAGIAAYVLRQMKGEAHDLDH